MVASVTDTFLYMTKAFDIFNILELIYKYQTHNQKTEFLNKIPNPDGSLFPL